MEMDKKIELITRNLQEVVGKEQIVEILKKRDLKVYWGTAPTGKPHIGYFVPIVKIGELLQAGCEVKILFADIHAYLDNMKSSWDQLEKRTRYYEILIKQMLTAIGVDISKLHFVKGSDYQLDKNYTLDVYKLAALTSTRDATRAGSEVVKQVESPKLSGLIYPILQALDEVYLDVDAQFGGVDQRKIFMYARDFLSKINHPTQIHLMNPMVPGLQGSKMSSSESNSKIDVLDTSKSMQKKFNKAHCIEGEVEDNGLIELLRLVVFPVLDYQDKTFFIHRPEKFGGALEYKNVDALISDFKDKKLHPVDLKKGVSDFFIELTEPIRKHFEEEDLQKLVEQAYE